MKLIDLARALDAELLVPDSASGGGDVEVEGVAPIQDAIAGQITFLTSGQYARFLADTKASAVILGARSDDCRIPQLLHENPYWAYAKATQLFYVPRPLPTGVSDRAFVSDGVQLGAEVTIHGLAYIDEGARLGDRVVVYPGAYVGRDVVIGDDTVLHANCVVEADSELGRQVIVHAGAVIGGDGFGFAPGREGLAKIVQSGRVSIGDDVEVGPNSTVDRGALADTVIGRGTKIDSQVQIAHNVTIGEDCMLCGMTAIAGSAKLGNRVLIAGHSAVNNNCEIGDNVQAGGMTGLTKHTREAGQYLGVPAMPASDWRKEQVRLRRLPKLERRVRELETALQELLANEESPD